MAKILFVSQFMPPPNSGGQTGGTISNLNLLRSLSVSNSVSVLSFDRTSKETCFVDEPFNVYCRPSPNWNGLQLIRFWQSFVRNEVARFLSENPAPGILIATTSAMAAFDATRSEITRVAIVQAYENFGFRCPWVPFRQRINLGKMSVIARFQDSRLMRLADAVWTNSKFMRSATSKRFGINSDKIHVLTQALDVAPANAYPPPNTIGFVTRGRDKGIAFVFELARRSPDLTYLIFGHHGDLPEGIPENVKWKGWVSDRSAMFSSAGLWIVPSLWAEPFGRVSIEAQAANRAVLVAAHGGLPETVYDPLFQINGFSPDEWLARMRSLFQLSSDYLSWNGARVRKAFSQEVHDKHLRLACEINSKSQHHLQNEHS